MCATTPFMDGIKGLFTNKSQREVYIKAAEEMNELVTKLLQYANEPSKITDDELLEEIVDVQMHLILLMKYHPIKNQLEQSEIKIMKFINSTDYKTYVK